MRDLIREVTKNARRPGDRVGVDGPDDMSSQLAAEAIRLARLATSIHLADATRLQAAQHVAGMEAWPARESVR